MSNDKKIAFLLLGPCSAGKTFLLEKIVGLGGGIMISTTTRPPRNDDKIMKQDSYEYLTEPEFRQSVANNEFIGWMSYDGNSYGCRKDPTIAPFKKYCFAAIGINEKGIYPYRDFLLRRKIEPVVVLVTPENFQNNTDIESNLDEIRKRITSRSFSNSQIKKRLFQAKKLYEWTLRHSDMIDEIIITTAGDFEHSENQLIHILNNYKLP